MTEELPLQLATHQFWYTRLITAEMRPGELAFHDEPISTVTWHWGSSPAELTIDSVATVRPPGNARPGDQGHDP